MDNTASFSNRSNAKRAAEQMIAKGTAPAVDYGFKTREGGRFEIVWQTAAAAPATGQAETTVAGFDPAAEALDVHKAWQGEQAARDAATGTDWFPGTEGTHFAGVPLADNAAAGAAADAPAPVTEAAEPQNGGAPSTEPQPQPDPFPADTYVKVRTGKRKIRIGHIASRVDEQHWRVRLIGAAEGVTVLASAAELYRAEGEFVEVPAAKGKPPRRNGATGTKASRSRYAIDPKAIASGKLPANAPVVTSAANPHYQKHFDKLFAHAKGGEWDAVRDYNVTGSNSYSKMIARYRHDLLALQAASETAQ